MSTFLSIIKNGIKKIFGIDFLLDELRSTLQNEGLEGGIRYLKEKYTFFKPASIRFLIGLYEYLLKEQSLSIYRDHNKPIVLHFCCWGARYANKARRYLLPSLLAEGNLPALAKKHKVIIVIHCDQKAKEILFGAGEATRLQRYASIEVIELPENVLKHYHAAVGYPNISFFRYINRRNDVLKYLLLGALQTKALHECVQLKATVSFLMPDVVLSDSFLSTAMGHIQEKKMVLSSTFRTNFYSVKGKLDNFYSKSDQEVLVISAQEMVRMQIEHLHSHEERQIVSEKTTCFRASTRLIFKINNGLMIRALHYHPILVNCHKLKEPIRSDYCPIDDAVLINILSDDLSYDKQVWLCSDASLMNMMELSDDEPDSAGEKLVNEPTLSYNELVSSFCQMLKSPHAVCNNKLNRYFIQNKLTFVVNGNFYQESDAIDSDFFIRDIYNTLDHGDE